MDFLRRAFISIKRQLGKTIILTLLVFILGAMMTGAASIRTAIGQTEYNLWLQMPPVATISLDFEAGQRYKEETGNEPEWERSLTPEEIRRIGTLPYVSSFEYSLEHAFWHDEFEFYGNSDDLWSEAGNVAAKGVYSSNMMDVQEGIIGITSGRSFTDIDLNGEVYTALISQQFAEINNLTIGSIIRLESRIYHEGWFSFNPADWRYRENIEQSEIFELEVIGIFEILKELEFEHGITYEGDQVYDFPSLEEFNFYNLVNQIYVPMSLIEAAPSFDLEALTVENSMSAFFTLDDPFEMPNFVQEANALLPGGWSIIEPSGHFRRILTTFETMQWISDMIFFGTILASVFILSLLLILFLRDRRHEIGIYLALGERKIRITLQIIVEVLFPSTIAFLSAIFVGYRISHHLSRIMLEQDLVRQIENSENAFFSNLVWHGVGEMNLEEMMSHFNVNLDIVTVLMILSVGLFAVLIATSISIWQVMKLNPKKVLM